MHPPERDSSGLTVVDEALGIVHLRTAGAWRPPRECEPVAGMDNADAFDCQGTWAGRVREASLQVVRARCGATPDRPASPPDMTGQETFDYVVVGAGAAGSAAAARIVEEGRHSVALIEAGRDDPWVWLKIPLGIGIVLTGERAVRRYWTEAEPNLGSRRIFWPRGRVLGGTSTINGMLWVRGDPAEYDRWADLGCKGWDFGSVLPHFKRMEACTLGRDTLRGRTGKTSIVEYSPRDPLSSAFFKACTEAGIAANDDYNGDRYEGVGYLQLNTRRGFRHGVREAYLRSLGGNRNLTILCDTTVESVVIENRRAISVRIRVNGAERTIGCRREVVLAAGAIDTPKILELSGIGDPDRLLGLGIEPVHALRGVGEGLRDHLHTRLTFHSARAVTLNDVMRSPARKMLFGLRYLLSGKGLMATSTATVHALAQSAPERGRPDIKLQLHPLSAPEIRSPDRVELDAFSGFGIGTFPLRPASTGSVHIASRDPREQPRIRPNYLDDPDDLACAIAAVRLARRVAAQPALSDLIVEEVRPGAEAKSDEAIAAFIRETGTTSYHPVGTCRMGVDAMAVVDPELRVIGLEGLRVADASVFPTMPSSNTHAPSILVGEIAAALVNAG